MREVDADSWHLSVSGGSATLHAVLFLRDAFQLKPDEDDRLPARLAGDVPNLSSLVPGFDPFDAALEWTAWWDRALAYEVDVAQGEFQQGSGEEILRAMASKRATFFDPPNFESMDDAPTLRALAKVAHREALQWNKFHSAKLESVVQRATRPSVVSRVAWETCVSLHVTPSQLRATVLVLNVDGSWRSFPRPGVMLCSANVLRKESNFEASLREVFLGNLGLGDAQLDISWPYGDLVTHTSERVAEEFDRREDPYFFGPSTYVH